MFFQSRRVFIGKCVHAKDLVMTALQGQHQAAVVGDMTQASVYVVKSVTEPGQRIMWFSKLNGRYVVSSDWVMGNYGAPWIKYTGVKDHTPRKHLLLDTAFRSKHPSLTEIIKAVLGNCKGWSLYAPSLKLSFHFVITALHVVR